MNKVAPYFSKKKRGVLKMSKDWPVVSVRNVLKSMIHKNSWVSFFSSTNTGFRAFFYYIRAPGLCEVTANEY